MLLLGISLIAFACSNNDDDSFFTQDLDRIIGIWNVRSYTIDGFQALGNQFQTMTVEFKEDSKVTTRIESINGTDIDEGTYIINEAAKMMTIIENGESAFFDYILFGNELELEAEIDNEQIAIVMEK